MYKMKAYWLGFKRYQICLAHNQASYRIPALVMSAPIRVISNAPKQVLVFESPCTMYIPTESHSSSPESRFGPS